MQHDLNNLPAVAKLLGYGGVIPFAALSIAIVFDVDLSFLKIVDNKVALLHYAAVIISFIGAVHWGVALTDERACVVHYVYGIAPAIVAWILLLLPAKPALLGMAAAVTAAYFVDRKILFHKLSSAYQVLRLHLTLAVTVSLLAACVAV